VAGWTGSFGASSYSDAWVLKLDSSGNVQWQKTYGGANGDEANSIQQTSDGGYIVAGWTGSFGAGYSDFWVLKLDSNGNITGCSAEGTSSAQVNTTNVSGTNSSVRPADTSVNLGTSTATINNTTVSPGQGCYYATTYTLSVTKSGTGSGTVTSSPAGISCGNDCTEPYTANTSVTLTAQADTGSTFGGWGGDCSSCGSNTTCTISMNANKSCTATFTQNPLPPSTYTLSVTKSGTGSGTVTSSPAGISCGNDCTEPYTANTSVTLTATADTGSSFTGWGDACSSCGANATCSITMDANKSCTAAFNSSSSPVQLGFVLPNGSSFAVADTVKIGLQVSGGSPDATAAIYLKYLQASNSWVDLWNQYISANGIFSTPTPILSLLLPIQAYNLDCSHSPCFMEFPAALLGEGQHAFEAFLAGLPGPSAVSPISNVATTQIDIHAASQPQQSQGAFLVGNWTIEWSSGESGTWTFNSDGTFVVDWNEQGYRRVVGKGTWSYANGQLSYRYEEETDYDLQTGAIVKHCVVSQWPNAVCNVGPSATAIFHSGSATVSAGTKSFTASQTNGYSVYFRQ